MAQTRRLEEYQRINVCVTVVHACQQPHSKSRILYPFHKTSAHPSCIHRSTSRYLTRWVDPFARNGTSPLHRSAPSSPLSSPFPKADHHFLVVAFEGHWILHSLWSEPDIDLAAVSSAIYQYRQIRIRFGYCSSASLQFGSLLHLARCRGPIG